MDKVAIGALAGLLGLGLYRVSQRAKQSRFPPGPKSSWWGGVEMPKLYPWLVFAEWQDIYGDVIYVRQFGSPILILNSQRAITDLLENRGNVYSSRPRRVMANELMGWDWMFSTMTYGPRWRKHRALFQKYFHVRTSSHYQPTQEKEAYTLLRNLLDTPEEFSYHVRRLAAAIFMNLSYGHQIKDDGDEFVAIANKATSNLARAGIFGTYIVDYFPWLKHIPSWMATFRRDAIEWRKSTETMINYPYDQLRERMAAGIAPPSFASSELENAMRSGITAEREQIIKNVAGMSFAAGSDTTASAVMSFILAMVIHPEIQLAAQEELACVIGTDRLPRFSDRDSLPMVECLVWESLRWNPVTPLGLQHFTTEDDVYRDWFIPKGTTVFTNIWKLLHDDEVYPNPLSFLPWRFMDRNKNDELGINPHPMPAFGFGRRVCPGRHMAIDTIWITIATILAVYEIRKALDKDGKPIEPDTEYVSSFLSRPKPFQCQFRPRSESARLLIRHSVEWPSAPIV
ncbi:cytochrome P450 monooxygenase [Vararia minispora EC-137]|uniref:Cytochrome P450 monooxygenase n=1 Tax=Vararia minispora EC-137 TaxID=1314806 RepID=A0ACB8QYE9_9AGAM|nr:cytochrome P450 monooxygenase [Vararia minispora EC-137]